MTEPPQLPPRPPEAWEPMLRLVRLASRPLERFLRIEAASSILLLTAALAGLVLENSRFHSSFQWFLHIPLGVRVGAWRVERTVEWVVNDVLMVAFFFVVGMEIRREIHHGELSTPRRAALPFAAALGGMLCPALVYLSVGGSTVARSGWGIPMATDIAFAVGVFAALGRRVPPALRVLLLALAVIDDLGAIVVIALFYSGGIKLAGMGVAGLGLVAIFALQSLGVRRKLVYVAPGVVIWLGFYLGGLHPTLAGVLVGFVTPVRAWLGPRGFQRNISEAVEALTLRARAGERPETLSVALRRVDRARREALSPAVSLIHMLHPWVAFVIMPLFALTNAGVSLRGASLATAPMQVSVGVALGLAVGKPLGVLVATTLALRLGLAVLPVGISVRHLVVLGVTAGIGFTMSLFTAQLAFHDPTLLANAKVGVLGGSVVTMIAALALGRALLSRTPTEGEASSADEAESSTRL